MNIGIPSNGRREHSSQCLEYVGHVVLSPCSEVFSLGTLDFLPPDKTTVQNTHSTMPEDLQVPKHQLRVMWLPLLIRYTCNLKLLTRISNDQKALKSSIRCNNWCLLNTIVFVTGYDYIIIGESRSL